MFIMARHYFDNPFPPYDLITISQDVLITHDREAAWVVAAYAGDELIHYVQFDWDATIIVDGTDVGAAWTVNQWENLVMQVDLLNGQADVTYGGNLISTTTIVGNPSLGIANIIIFMDDVIGAEASSLFYDNLSVTAIPEPATFGLLGLGLFGFLTRRRRSR